MTSSFSTTKSGIDRDGCREPTPGEVEIRWFAEIAPHLDFTLALERAEADARVGATQDLHFEQVEASE